MKIKLIVLLLFIVIFNSLIAQNSCVFRTYRKVTDTIFATNVPILNPNNGYFLKPTLLMPVSQTNVTLKMNLYIPNLLPNESVNKKMPLVILCNPTSTTGPIKNSHELDALRFVTRGYVVACFDYRWERRSGLAKSTTEIPLLPTNTLKQRSNLFESRRFYSHAMDVNLLLNTLFQQCEKYRIDTNKVIIGGHSQGSGTALYSIYIDKEEIASKFPNVFNTDNRYLDIDKNSKRIKTGFVTGAGLRIESLSCIDESENQPIFFFHGMKDAASPYYYAPVGCFEYGADYYGSGAIVEKLDNFAENLGFSYYFVEAEGIGHRISFCDTTVYNINQNQSFVSLWYPDLFRFLENSLMNTTNGYKNQFRKIISPINDCFNYCNSTFFNNNCNFQTLPGTCFTFPELNLTTKSWIDSIPNQCTSIFPLILSDCYSNMTCNSPANNSRKENTNIYNTNFNDIKVKVFPNPVSNKINLYLSNETPISNAQLKSDNGNVVNITLAKLGDKEYQIDVSELSNGVYILNIYYEGGFYTNKVIVTK